MKKIEVNHTTDFIRGVSIAIAFLWAGLIVFLCSVKSDSVMWVSTVGVLIMLIIASVTNDSKTIVEYDTETIRWKWLWLTYTVNLNEMLSAHYTITLERTRGDYIRRLEIVFNVKEGTLRLNDKLKTEDIENYINGTPDDIKLMELYKFIESTCPEKSHGFTKTSDEIF
ncbi:MAG: hypothetical protein NC177_00220 [Ruminococcus flavefaciens]|nr:hypothetical protein [Ruminococcus flavefaciens]